MLVSTGNEKSRPVYLLTSSVDSVRPSLSCFVLLIQLPLTSHLLHIIIILSKFLGFTAWDAPVVRLCARLVMPQSRPVENWQSFYRFRGQSLKAILNERERKRTDVSQWLFFIKALRPHESFQMCGNDCSPTQLLHNN